MKKVNEKEIIKCLKQNEICVMPTDTVYGLMMVLSKANEEKLNLFKHSDINKKISIIFPSVDDLLENIDFLEEDRIQMIKDKLPGKYTFIVNLKKEFTSKYGFSRNDFGVRVTSNENLQNILKEVGPVLATSSNYSKEDICKNMSDIERNFNDKDIYVYYEGEKENIPSSIIVLNQKEISTIR